MESRLSPDLLAPLPDAVRADIPWLDARVAQLDARVVDLEARLQQNSPNSSRPPSSDPPSVKPAPPRTPSGRARGGQPGHPKAERKMLPPDVVIPVKPGHCRGCRHPLDGEDPGPLVHQVLELPAVRPHVTEYRRHRLACPGCGAVTCAPLPDDVAGGYGPRTQAICALLAGGHRLGKRAISPVMGDLFGLPISPAAVCDLQRRTAAALQPIAAEALAYTRGRPANVDETSWTEAARPAWVWVAVTERVVAVLIRRGRDRCAFDDLVGDSSAVLTTDRYRVYTHLPAARRQVCQFHTIRTQSRIRRLRSSSSTTLPLLTP